MARRTQFEPNPNPLDAYRNMLTVPEPIKFRRRAEVVEGARGNGWAKANHHGWEGNALICYAREFGGWRTLDPELWEWKSV